MKTNKDKVVMMSVQGTVAPPGGARNHMVSKDGMPFLLPGTGGIVYNIKVGDPVYGWSSDHIEPCVSTSLDEKNKFDPPN
ncbi:DUF4438 domain-containing protein, partial [bacterium]|nr:DUF4438 domain-containing protein [bacterium]